MDAKTKPKAVRSIKSNEVKCISDSRIPALLPLLITLAVVTNSSHSIVHWEFCLA